MESTTTWRGEEVARVIALLNTAQPYDHFTPGQIREGVFDDPDYNPELLRCLRVGGNIVAAGAGVLRVPRGTATQPTGFVKLLAVRPDWQGRGLGSALLNDLEERLRALGAPSVRIFSDAPMYLRPGVDFRSTRFVCMLLHRGYVFRRNAVNMDVDLVQAPLDTAADEARLAQAGIVVRRLVAADEEALREYMAKNWSWGWLVETNHTLRHQPVTTHLALRDGAIVGFASAGVMGPNHFGPMGVNPDQRHHGVGAVLLKRCLADLRDLGFPTADIQWVGPIGFYARHVGATLSRCFWQMEREFPSG